eukprot:jgi/Picsp_1/3264/NSC_06104-R1_nucleotide-sugar transporter family protein
MTDYVGIQIYIPKKRQVVIMGREEMGIEDCTESSRSDVRYLEVESESFKERDAQDTLHIGDDPRHRRPAQQAGGVGQEEEQQLLQNDDWSTHEHYPSWTGAVSHLDGLEAAGSKAPVYSAVSRMSRAVLLCSILTLASCSSSILAQLSKDGDSKEYKYNTATVPVMSEMVKLVISVSIVWVDYWKTGSVHANTTWKDFCSKYLIIGFLYAILNNLLFVVLLYMDPGTMEVLGNLKLPLTALLLWKFLDKSFSRLQITGLLLITCGAAVSKMGLVSCSGSAKKNDMDDHGGDIETEDGSLSCDRMHLGVLIMLVMCCISSGAGVANEILLKHGDNGPLFWQNMQLYASTCVFSLLNATLHAKVPLNGSFFQGYDWMTICVILSLAFVGIIVSITLKYADNIVHSIASALAMILATVFSVTVMHEEFSMLAIPGYLAIVFGVSLYFGVFGSK